MAVLIGLILLISFTYYYVIALSISILTIVCLSAYLSQSNTEPYEYLFTLTNTGVICFDKKIQSYQLLATSRLSFLGCWLNFEPEKGVLNDQKPKNKAIGKQVFIFRDSLSSQDFSRIANIIKQLKKMN